LTISRRASSTIFAPSSIIRGSRFREHDVTKSLSIAGRVDRIYNLACAASPRHYQRDPIGTMMTCTLGARKLLELGREKSARVLQASTSEVYGDPEVHSQREDYVGHVNPIGPRVVLRRGQAGRRDAVLRLSTSPWHVDQGGARIFNTYGPRMLENDGRVVSNFIVQALRDEPVAIYGDGNQTRSFCFVDDLVSGLELLMASDEDFTGRCNLGNPHEVTIREIAERILCLARSRSPLRFMPLPQDDRKRAVRRSAAPCPNLAGGRRSILTVA
jgi:UDP-glucuronate decarboxylase